jgi:ABC-type nitrate/sulfonate/bicarbonate transport system substrate-binding protein
MVNQCREHFCRTVIISVLCWVVHAEGDGYAVEKLIGLHSARVMSQSLPWIAQDAGIFKKYDLDFPLVYATASSAVTAAMLSGGGELALTGGEGIIRTFVQGINDFVFIGGVKNVLTHSILAKPEIKKPEDLKGKKVGLGRIGGNPHYFAIQALRQKGLDPTRDVTFIQTGGAPETLAALAAGGIDAGVLTAPGDTQAVALGFNYVVYGPDLRMPFAAAVFVTRRPVIAQRSQVLGQFMRAMAEAAKIIHTDREFTYKVLEKQLRLADRKILDASYNLEIKVLETKLDLKPEGLQAILDDVSKVDPRAKKVKPQDLMDRRYIDEMEKSGFFNKLWAGKG